MADRPERQPAVAARITKAPSSGHPARSIMQPDAEETPSRPVEVAPEPPEDPPVEQSPPAAKQPRRQNRRPSAAAPPVEDEPLVQFGARVPKSIRQRARMWSLVNEVDLQDMLTRAVREFLDRNDG